MRRPPRSAAGVLRGCRGAGAARRCETTRRWPGRSLSPGRMLFIRISVLHVHVVAARDGPERYRRGAPRAPCGARASAAARAAVDQRAAARSTLSGSTVRRDGTRRSRADRERPAAEAVELADRLRRASRSGARPTRPCRPAAPRGALDAHALVRRQQQQVLAERVGRIDRQQQVMRAGRVASPSGGRPGSARTVPRS